jgi:Tfp pilus assembly protein PilP
MQSGVVVLTVRTKIIRWGLVISGCGQDAQAAPLSGLLTGMASEAATRTLQLTNLAVQPATVSNAAAQTLAPNSSPRARSLTREASNGRTQPTALS